MCLLALQFRTCGAAPVMIAANREEYFDRPAQPPTIQPGQPRVLCGTDLRAGGTWLGVNEFGLVVGVTNRYRTNLPETPRSRGALCRDLLLCGSAQESIDLAVAELSTGHYAGANFLCADARRAFIVQYEETLNVTELAPGLHLMTNWAVDDRTDERQLFARFLFAKRYPNSPDTFLETAAEICRQGPVGPQGPTIILRAEDRGTVSSTLMAITKRVEDSKFLYADGAPDQVEYQDFSTSLRELLTNQASAAR